MQLVVGAAESPGSGLARAVLILGTEVTQAGCTGLVGLAVGAVLVQACSVEALFFPRLGELLGVRSAAFLLRGGCAVPPVSSSGAVCWLSLMFPPVVTGSVVRGSGWMSPGAAWLSHSHSTCSVRIS
ncbi:hypothetical protein V3C33_19535 [Micrococcaceae bacterium Sec5.7]